jgi:hypothetical protein
MQHDQQEKYRQQYACELVQHWWSASWNCVLTDRIEHLNSSDNKRITPLKKKSSFYVWNQNFMEKYQLVLWK